MVTIAKRIVRSRLGWILAILELATIIYWFRGGDAASSLLVNDVYTGRFIGGRFVELHSTLSFVLVIVNVIPVLAAQLLSKAVSFVIPSLSVLALSWVHAFELLFLSTVQCLIVGYLMERMVALVRNREPVGTAPNKSLDRSRGKRVSHQA